MHKLSSQRSSDQDNRANAQNSEMEENILPENYQFQWAKWIYFDYFQSGNNSKNKEIIHSLIESKNIQGIYERKNDFEEDKDSKLENIKSSLSMLKGMKHRL